MKRVRITVSYILMLAMFFTMLPLNFTKTEAATNSNYEVLSYRYNAISKAFDLTLTWVGNKGVDGINVAYFREVSPGVNSKETQTKSAVEIDDISLYTSRYSSTIDVTYMKQNYVYELKINTTGSGGDSTPRSLFFMTGMSFTSERMGPSTTPAPGDKFESGTEPELKLAWQNPKIYNEVSNSWAYVNDNNSKDYIANKLNLDPLTGVDFSYRINISKKAQTLESGPDISPILLKDIGDTGTDGVADYSATIDSDNVKTTQYDSTTNEYSINLLGRKDSQTNPTKDPTDPTETRLYHSQIMPGTVYFMNIKPQFVVDDVTVDAITVGDPTQYNGSLVKDSGSQLAYTYTPVRFEISRDASDNIYVTAYRVNKDDGSLDMPNLYYSVQAIDTPTNNYGVDWPEKARMTDQFFPKGSQYAVTVLSGVDPNTTLFYRVVVKTDSKQDRIESLKMSYKMSTDTSRPPVPINVRVEMDRSVMVSGPEINPTTGSIIKDEAKNDAIMRSTNVVFSWDKPKNWDALTPADKQALIYHIVINTNVEDLDIKYPLEIDNFKGEYNVKYRWIKSIAAKDMKASTDGKRLEYTLNGFDIFTNTDDTKLNDLSKYSLNNPDKYPTWLLENTIYYAKVFSTKSSGAIDFTPTGLAALNDNTADALINIDDFKKYADTLADATISQQSVPCSFTTLPGIDKEVPVPTGFKATGEDIEGTPPSNFINLQFERTNIEWTKYTSTIGNNKTIYEIFMTQESGTGAEYFKVGDTEGYIQSNTQLPKATLELVKGVWTAKVTTLKPNTIYKFKLRLKLVFEDTNITPLYSAFTALVNVTTRKLEILEPDENLRVPKAPVDFDIATLTDGNQDLTSTYVGLDWSVLEENITYRMIATSKKISANAEESEYKNDPYYIDFIEDFGTKVQPDNVNNLDPDPVDPNIDFTYGNFSYTAVNSTSKYKVHDFMVPNRLYYYSLRAERKVYIRDTDGTIKEGPPLKSSWVTVPVTTSMIEAPLELETVVDYQLGVSWEDTDSKAIADDYEIHLKETSKSTYTTLDVTKATITKDDFNYYGRIRGLNAGISYDIQVYKGNTAATLTLVTTVITPSPQVTRDEYHNIEVRWKGSQVIGDYELAIRTEINGEYKTLNATDFDITREKNSSLVKTPYYMYYARIKTEILSSGNISIPLKSNTKYLIKVRAITKIPGSSQLVLSNYAGPVFARTSFNQDDYDGKDDLEEAISKLVDRIEKLEEKPYYPITTNSQGSTEVLLKVDRLAEELRIQPNKNLTLDLTAESSLTRRDAIFIPDELSVAIKETGGSVTIKLNNVDYTILPGTLDTTVYEETSKLKKDNTTVKEIWYKLSVSRPEGETQGLENGVVPIADVNILSVEFSGSNTKFADIKKDFNNKVYNTETGLLKQKKDKMAAQYDINPAAVLSQGNGLVDSLYSEIESELMVYINSTIKGGYGKMGILTSQKSINEFKAPLLAVFNRKNTSEYSEGYVLPFDSYNWTNIYGKQSIHSIEIQIFKPGKYLIAKKNSINDILPESHWAKQSFIEMNSKYNLAEIFKASGTLQLDLPMSIKESILLLDKCFTLNEITTQSLQSKAISLGISKYISGNMPMKDLSREEAAALLMVAYSKVKGIDLDTAAPSKVTLINDDRDIGQKYLRTVESAIGLGFMDLNANGDFKPKDYVSRAQFVDVMNKIMNGRGM